MIRTNDIYSILISVLILITIGCVEIKRKRSLDFLLVFNFSYALFYSIVPIVIILNQELLYYNTMANWAPHFTAYREYLIPSLLFAFLFYVVFILTYNFLQKRRFISEETKTKSYHINVDVLFGLGIAFLLFGIISFFIYSSTMGGPYNAIIYAQLKRSGVYETTGPLTFFKHFMKSVYFGLFVFMTVKPKRALFNKVRSYLLVVSAVFSVIVLLAYAGRANIVILLITLLLYKNVLENKILYNKKQIIHYGVFIILFGLVSAFYRPFMLMISGKEIVFSNFSVILEIVSSVVKYFSVPIISMMVALGEVSITDISLGTGFLQVFLDIIPKSIIDADLVYTVNNLNTELFGFVLDSRNYNIPSGLIAYFFYEFYWAGIIIGGIITGFVIKFSDDLLRYLKGNRTIGIIMVYFMFNLPNRMLAGDQVGGIKGFLILYLEFLVLFILLKRTTIKNYPKEGSVLTDE